MNLLRTLTIPVIDKSSINQELFISSVIKFDMTSMIADCYI